MLTYTLELELFGIFSLDMPGFEIWADGAQLGTTSSISSAGTFIATSFTFAGALPSSLEFRFSDASTETPRSIEVRSVKINDNYVNTANFLSSDSLTNGQVSVVDIPSASFIFDDSEPSGATFTTGATQTFTTGIDFHNNFNGTADETFDLLAGSDYAHTGSGNDTIAGGAGDDTLRGGAGDDLIYGGADNDSLYGMDDNDTLYGGAGDDRLYGNDGDDELFGNAGEDNLNGHNGDDLIVGGDGDDKLNGGSGADQLFGGADNDSLVGGSGDDTLDGGDGDDIIYGGANNDVINGGDGADILIGNIGADIINGNDGDDIIYVMLNDFQAGEAIYGGAGSDELVITRGSTIDFTTGVVDELETLTGSDDNQDVTYTIAQALQFTTIDLGGGTDNSRVQANGTQDVTGLNLPTITNAENGFLTGSTGDDDITITGAQVNALIFGAGIIDFDTGTDVLILTTISSDLAMLATTDGGIIGLEEIDYSTVGSSTVTLDLTAQTEDFIVSTANGQDIVTGGSGDDTLNGNIGNDDLFGGIGNDTINGGQGFDDITGGAGADIIDGGTENDRISGGGTEFLGDIIDGGAGTNDSLVLTADTTFDATVSFTNIERLTFNVGGAHVINVTSGGSVDFTGLVVSGNSVIRGMGSNETIIATEASDTIQGGNGADTLSGNAGNDLFIGGGTEFLGDTFDGGSGTDTIDLFADSLFNLANTFTDVERIDLNNFNITTLVGQGYDFTGLTTAAAGDLFDSTGNETISGSESNDDLVIGIGADIVNGNAGNDRFFLSNGDFAAGESLTGDAGTDSIILSNATTIDLSTGTIATIETFLGSAGNDDVTYTFSQLDAFGSINLQGGIDNSRVQANGTINVTGFSLPSVINEENGFIVGSSGDDDLTITGAQVNTLIVGAGAIDFAGGNDVLRLTTTSSDLNILGSTDGSIDGLETIDFSSATASITIDLNAQTEGFIIIGSDQLDNITTGDGDDTIIGGDGNDTINGGDGDDILSGDLATVPVISGLITVEAESFNTNTPKSGHEWEIVSDASAVGGSAVFIDNRGADNFWVTETQTLNDAPQLNYTVSFPTTGTYYILIRGNAPDNLDDSIHIGLNGSRETDDAGITGFVGGYNWTSTNPSPLAITVTTTGNNTINLWAREDGVTIDTILLTTDASFVPTGFGPTTGEQNSASGGDDIINGGAGNDIIQGDVGNDILNGGADDDTIIGGADDDVITGGTGLDTIEAGDGNDTINLANGDFTVLETIIGGEGTDTITLTNATTVDFSTGVLNTVEILTGSSGNDDVTYTLQQVLAFDSIDLGGGIDNSRVQFSGLQRVVDSGLPTGINAENSFIVGSAGDDDLTITGAQVNTLIVGAGTIDFAGGTDVLSLTTVSSDLNILAATDASIAGLEEIDMSIVTSAITLDLSAQTEDFIITSGTSADTITGGSGSDTINGGTGDDILSGEAVTAITSTSTQGWSYQYYDLTTSPNSLALAGFNLNGQRDNNLASTDTGISSNFDPNNFDTGDNYALKFESTLTVTTAGTYTFRTNSDDGSQLFLDGVQIVDNSGLHGDVTVTSAGQFLAAGTYTLELTFFERSGGNVLGADISGPDTGGGFVGLANYSGANVVTLSSAAAGGDDFIAGGGGTDVLYGGAGADTFIFEAVSAFAETDTITDFSTTDGDRLDISDIITGAFSGDIKDYLQFTSDGATGDTLVQVDANGITGGTNFSTIARLDGIVGIDEVALFNAGDIIV